MSDALAPLLDRLPDFLGAHVRISVVSLVLGVAVSFPLAIAAFRSSRWRVPALATASVIQTIPSLALLALFYPLLLGVKGLVASWFGVEISALGFLPTVLALTLYSMLPILRNTVAGLEGVDPAAVEAARGLGMTPGQVLRRVQLPLALPVIVAGLRTATVWVVGIATLSTPVGQASLGNYIFQGLQTENWIAVLFGCVFAALLALVLDRLIGLLERAAALRRPRRAAVALVGLLAVVAVGVAPLVGRAERGLVVGAKTFGEQFILASLLEHRLQAAGVDADVARGLGSGVVFRALVGGEIDICVDYSGTIWVNHMNREDNPGREAVLHAVTEWLREEHGVVCLGSLGFENAYGIAVRRDLAEALALTTVADLAPHAGRLAIGGTHEFFARPEWAAIREAYDLEFAEEVQFDATFMYRALAQDEVQVIAAFTSDGRVAEHDLVVLEDPKEVIPPYDAILLLGPDAAADERVVAALRPLVGAVDVVTMRRANLRVDRDADKQSPDEAARWLERRLDLPPSRE